MAITDKNQVKTWVDGGSVPGDVFDDAWGAAEDYVGSRVSYPTEPDPDTGQVPPVPDALVQAVNLMTARYLARRNSPDGMIGLGDLGATRVPFSDIDVERLMNPWRDIAVA